MTTKHGLVAKLLPAAGLLVGLVSSPRTAAQVVGPVTLTLVSPVPGPPGTPAGWGFTATNFNSSYWVVITGVTASPELTALGTFTDFLAQYQWAVLEPALVANPGAILTETFDDATHSGIGSLVCATSNAAASGTITVTYDVYSADPRAPGFDPTTSAVSYGNWTSAPATFGTTPVGLERFEAE